MLLRNQVIEATAPFYAFFTVKKALSPPLDLDASILFRHPKLSKFPPDLMQINCKHTADLIVNTFSTACY